ncbi:MAG: tRNA pseudouridine synthase A [Bacteroidales bacterium]|nr:tRNA pseudouridine synthase A [Bacteroidales bacterium]
MRYSLCLSYDGADFCGWQVQPEAPSVQAALESTLSRLLNTPVQVTGAGRTDTLVNAANYVAHFDYPGELPFGQGDFCYKLNAMLPRSVAVVSVSPVPDDFHARFDARRREYTYFIHRKKDPFVRAYSWQCGYPVLDFDAMNAACKHLLGTHDFSCFEKTGTDVKTSVCTVCEAFWKPYVPSYIQVMNEVEGCVPETCGRPWPHEWEGPAARRDVGGTRTAGQRVLGIDPSISSEYWYFRVAADRFLRNMVRAIVGSLIEVGRGKHSPEWIAQLIENGTRGDAGESVPGHALFLSKVLY